MLDEIDYVLLIGGVAVTALAYWVGVAFYTAIPLLFPRHAARYKLQQHGTPMSAGTHARLILLTLFNQTLVAFVFIFIVGKVYFDVGGRFPLSLPAWPMIAIHFVLYAVTFEVMFYAFHRLLHVPLLYRRIHALHHRFRAPVPYSGACVHPVEFALSYLVPNLIAAACFNFSMAEMLLFLSVEYVHNVHDHSGYHYPWDPFGYICSQNSRAHDDHHRLYRVNYSGAFTMVLDRMFGTYHAPDRVAPVGNLSSRELRGAASLVDLQVPDVSPPAGVEHSLRA
jgi:sterol desaturase/sphingolipid hydroxylase (fatty acid hydroxylase superfamily)